MESPFGFQKHQSTRRETFLRPLYRDVTLQLEATNANKAISYRLQRFFEIDPSRKDSLAVGESVSDTAVHRFPRQLPGVKHFCAPRCLTVFVTVACPVASRRCYPAGCGFAESWLPGTAPSSRKLHNLDDEYCWPPPGQCPLSQVVPVGNIPG